MSTLSGAPDSCGKHYPHKCDSFGFCAQKGDRQSLVFKAGDRIRVHPAADLFMKGEVYASICFVRKQKDMPILRVAGERSGKRFWLSPLYVLDMA